MAEKASGRAQGRSRPQAQSKNQNRNRQSKQDPDSGGRASREARNGAAVRRGGADRQKEPDEQNEQDQEQQSGRGRKVAQTMKQHPITAAAVGAGLTLLAAQGLRMAIAGTSTGAQAKDDEQDDGAQASGSEDEEERQEGGEEDDESGEEHGLGTFRGRLGRLGSKFGSAFRGSGQAIQRGARSGFERGRQTAEQGWANHPLMLAGVALAVGAVAGSLIPSTRQEDRLMGTASDKVTGRVRKVGQTFFRQGRQIAGKVVHEAVDATSKEIEREGLSPDRLGKKVKRVLGNVRQAVAEAIEDEE